MAEPPRGYRLDRQKLIDVYPRQSQPAYNVADGVLQARYHLSFEKPKLLQPGAPYEFTVIC